MHKYVEKLLNGRKVEWRRLGDVAIVYNGLSGKSKSDFKNGKAKFVPYKNIFNNLEIDVTELDKVKILENEQQNKVQYGDVLFTASSETLEEVGISSVVTSKNLNNIYLNSFSFGIRFNKDIELLPGFSKYLFRSTFLRKQIIKTANGVTRFNISKERFKKIIIPIPPLYVQHEIVRVLDNFTELTAELTAELSLRKKQYEYYRDKLLTFGDEVEWKELGEIAKISSGGTPKTSISEYYNGDIPWLRTQEINFNEIWNTSKKITKLGLENSSAKWVPENSVILAMYGATVGKVAINKIPLTTNQACANIQVDENIIHYKFLFYYLYNQYHYIKSLGTGSQTNINAQIVKKLKIPIPSIEKQKEIVEILDKFDTLTNSITEGLPKEISLRQKQYEYYRDMLLDFKERE